MHCIIVIVLGSLIPVVVFGRPQISSSTESLELSGEQCPGTLTLTCDALNFGITDSIRWFVGNQLIAFFDLTAHSIPFTGTTTRPDILNATVQLTSATYFNNQSSFINFTLSASVSNFLPIQGHNISCGTLASRSLSFEIREFTVLNKSALFQGVNSSSSHTLEYSDCEATFKCISAVDGECVFEIIRNDMIEQKQRGAVNSSATFSNLMPNTLYFYQISFTSLQKILIIENKNFTTYEGSCGSSTSTAVIVGVVVPVVVLFLVLVVFIIVLVKMKFSHKKKTGSREPLPEAKQVMEFHGVDKEDIQFDIKGMSNVAGNVVPAHKQIGEKREPFLLKEKEKVSKAAHEVMIQEPHIYDQTEQIGNKQNIANTCKPAKPGPSGMYSKLNSSDEYSSLQHNTNEAQGQGPPAASVPRDGSYEPLNLSSVESNENNGAKPNKNVGNQQNIKRHRNLPDGAEKHVSTNK